MSHGASLLKSLRIQVSRRLQDGLGMRSGVEDIRAETNNLGTKHPLNRSLRRAYPHFDDHTRCLNGD